MYYISLILDQSNKSLIHNLCITNIGTSNNHFIPDYENLPKSAQHEFLQHFIKLFYNLFTQIPDENKIQIIDIINTYFSCNTIMDLDSTIDEYY